MTKDDVFQFVFVRPPQKANDENLARKFVYYDKSKKTSLHKQIEEILDGADRYNKAIQIARTFMTSGDYTPEQPALVNTIKKASNSKRIEDSQKIIAKELGKNVSDYLAAANTIKLKEQVWNSLYSQALLPNERPNDRDNIYDVVRAFHFLELLSFHEQSKIKHMSSHKQSKIKHMSSHKNNDDNDEDNEKPPMTWTALQNVLPIIPSRIMPPPPIKTENESESDIFNKRVAGEMENVKQKVFALSHSISDLRNNNRIYIANESRKTPDIAKFPRVEDGESIRPISLLDISTPTFKATSMQLVKPSETTNSNINSDNADNKSNVRLESVSILVPRRKPWLFEEFGNSNLTNLTKETINSRKKELAEFAIPNIISKLEQERDDTVLSFINSLSNEALMSIVDTDSFREISKEVSIPFSFISPTKSITAPIPGSAAARGIRPLGMGDLHVVKQELVRYELGEVAHIENVLLNENKTRTHTRINEFEETITLETEEVKESEKDLQSTERFELQKESQKTIESEMKFEAGLSVTGSYGFVSVTANADFALNQSSSESNKSASTFAKEVSERSVSRIKERVREERVRRVLERIEEKNEHILNNIKGEGNITGVYRWVDKYYNLRIINYGRRMMMEFIIPEPAAFYVHSQEGQELKGVTMKPPREPKVWGRKLWPTDLTKSSYMEFVSEYNVKDVKPYPEEVVNVSFAVAEAPGVGQNDNVDFAKTEFLKIPGGYEVMDVWGESRLHGIEFTNFFFEILVGGQAWGSVTGEGIEEALPISVNGWASAFNVSIVAQCRLKEETKKKWQLETFEAIMNGYERLLADYNEQVSAAQIQAGIEIRGRNPENNRKIERDELRKGVLRLLTDEYLSIRVGGMWRYKEKFDSMYDNGDFGYPEFSVSESLVESKIVQFFEQAFEWNNVTYRLYPYFWGRKSNWKDAFSPLDDPDPQFADFLRAGAARIVVPVRLSYTDAVLHYLYTNEIWNGGQPPAIDDPLYVSIIDEIKEDTEADINNDSLPICSISSGYPCVINEWITKIPTSLVYLQKGAELPNF